MNTANILALADFIEALPEDSFDMSTCVKEGQTHPNETCGSPSCIAGWAAWEQQDRPHYITDNERSWNSGNNNLINSALKYFGIIATDERQRVMNELFRGNYGDMANRRLSRADAAQVLRTFAHTGNIEWPTRRGR